MFNALLGGAFGLGGQAANNCQQWYQQQIGWMKNYTPLPICPHQVGCLKCKEERDERERIAAEKKVAYKNRCKEWMSKVGRKP